MFCAHLGSGGVHAYAVSEQARSEYAPQAEAFVKALYAESVRLGGDAAGEYGVGCTKQEYVAAERRERYAALKAELDPAGILNPGKAVR